MRSNYILVSLCACLAALAGCGDDSEEVIDVVDSGDIVGTVTDKETGDPVADATVDLGGETALTDADGRYTVEGIEFSDSIDVVVTAANYRGRESIVSLDKELLMLNITLVPIESLSAQVLDVLDNLSRGIGSLDPNEIPSIHALISEDYVPAKNEETAFGVFAGVVPPSYEGLPDSILKIIEKYDELEFGFADPSVEFNGDLASVRMRFEVYAETKPPEPKSWEIVLNGRLDLMNEEGDWRITYWKLSELLKFDEQPL